MWHGTLAGPGSYLLDFPSLETGSSVYIAHFLFRRSVATRRQSWNKLLSTTFLTMAFISKNEDFTKFKLGTDLKMSGTAAEWFSLSLRAQNTCQAGKTRRKKLSSSCSNRNQFLQKIPVKISYSSPSPHWLSGRPFSVSMLHTAPLSPLPGPCHELKEHELKTMCSRGTPGILSAWQMLLHWAPCSLHMSWGWWPSFFQVVL